MGGGGGDAEVLPEAVLHVLDRRPRPDRQRALLALPVRHVADEYPQVGTLGGGAGGAAGACALLPGAAGRPPGPMVAPTSSSNGAADAPGAVRQEGEFFFDDGAAYKGNFRHGAFHGHGEMNYPGGDRYTGKWRKGLRHGKGVLITKAGASYKGRWVRDSPEGKGKYV